MIRASRNGALTVRALARAIEAAVARGADVMNLSLAGPGFSLSQVRALADRVLQRRAPRGRVGQQRGERQPARVPRRGDRRHARTARHRPVGHGHACRAAGAPTFSTHNDYVSIAAPGRRRLGLRARRVLHPARRAARTNGTTRSSCSRLFSQGAVRFAYGEGTSFAAPLVSGLAALVWQVQPRLASEQVADVLHPHRPPDRGHEGWNEHTGAGVVDGRAATALARVYDLTAPAEARQRAPARRHAAWRCASGARATAPARAASWPGTCATRSWCRATAAGASTWRCAAGTADPPRRAPQGQPDERDRRRRVRPQRQLRDQAAGPVQAVLAPEVWSYTGRMCAACAIAAVAGATGVRAWLQARHLTWLTETRMRATTIALFVAALVASTVTFSGSGN